MNLKQIKKKLQLAYEQISLNKIELLEKNLKFIKNYRAESKTKDTSSVRVAVLCKKCGSFDPNAAVASVSAWRRPSIPACCPHCGEQRVIKATSAIDWYYGVRESSQTIYGVYEVNDEYAIVYTISARLFLEQVPAKTEKESLEKAKLVIKDEEHPERVSVNVGIVQYDKSHPWKLIHRNGNFSLTNTWFCGKNHVIEDEKMDLFVSKIDDAVPGTNIDNINKNVEEMCSANKSKATKKVSTSAAQKQEFVDRCLKFKPRDKVAVYKRVEKIFDEECVGIALERSVVAGYSTFEANCTHCNNLLQYKTVTRDFFGEQKELKCDCCGKTSQYSLFKSMREINKQNYYLYWSYLEDFDAVFLRVYEGRVLREKASDGKSFSKKELVEIQRAFLTKENNVFLMQVPYPKRKEEFQTVTSDVFCCGYTDRVNSVVSAINTESELKNIIEGTFLKYSGLIDAWGLGETKEFKYEEPGTFNCESYLYLWNSKKFVELLLKTGLTNIIKEIGQFKKAASYIVKPRAKNVCEMLGITKPVFKIAQEINPKIEDLNTIQKLWGMEQTLTSETYAEIAKLGKETIFVDIKNNFGISFEKQVAYSKDCYDYQCIERAEAMQLWADYLVLAKKAGYDLKNKNVKFPESLRMEHDICSFVASKMDNEYNEGEFLAKSHENAKFNYSLKTSKLFVVAPTAPEQVINEGMSLHHCVTNYVNAIIEGRSIVMFIRNEDEPDEPFYTAEILIKGGAPTITQIKGKLNLDPDVTTKDGKRVSEFVKKWAAFKHLNIDVKI